MRYVLAFCAAVALCTFSLAADSRAEHPRWAPIAPQQLAKSKQATPRTARYYRNRSSGSSGHRRYSYNYSGVGFPRMEGGLTAAANRTTWLKNP